jgi:hypothetical protein
MTASVLISITCSCLAFQQEQPASLLLITCLLLVAAAGDDDEARSHYYFSYHLPSNRSVVEIISQCSNMINNCEWRRRGDEKAIISKQ